MDTIRRDIENNGLTNVNILDRNLRTGELQDPQRPTDGLEPSIREDEIVPTTHHIYVNRVGPFYHHIIIATYSQWQTGSSDGLRQFH